MIFNLNKFQIEDIVLGDKVATADGIHENGVYNYFVENSIIRTINVRLSEFYSSGPIFTGQILIKDKTFKADKNFQPFLVLPLFENQTDNWNDGVELNHQFLVGNTGIEFSWNSESTDLTANYISIELQ